MTATEYQALAQFRYLIRRYLNNTEMAARSVGLEPQQYTCLLAVRGLPNGCPPTIRNVSERLQVKHHTTVEMIDRMERRGLLRRERSDQDRRSVSVHVTAHGEKVLSRLVRHRMTELREAAPALARSLREIIQQASPRAVRGRGVNGARHRRPQVG